MKHLSLLALLCLMACYGCKKGSSNQSTNQNVSVVVSNINPATTKYTLSLTNSAGTSILNIVNATTNQSYNLAMKPGDVIHGSFGFLTQGQQNGQGYLDFNCNGKDLYHFDGGTGSNLSISIPAP